MPYQFNSSSWLHQVSPLGQRPLLEAEQLLLHGGGPLEPADAEIEVGSHRRVKDLGLAEASVRIGLEVVVGEDLSVGGGGRVVAEQVHPRLRQVH